MKITHAAMHQVRLPLVHEFETSSHRKGFIEHIIIELRDEDGAVGWGEIASPSDPYYGPDTTETSWHVAEHYLLPGLLGHEWTTPDQASASWASIRGHEFAKAGVDMAAWTLVATARDLPLATLLGGTREFVDSGVSLGIEPTIDQLLDAAAGQLALGYRRIKVKIAPGWDVEPVRALRAAFGPIDLQVDANGAYPDDPETLAVLRALDAYGLTMIEQPFGPRALVASARAQALIATPICLDESIVELEDVRSMLALDAGRVVNIKVSRMGGLTTARAAHDLCAAEGLRMWCGGMHEFGIGRAANVALCSLPGFTLPSDVSASAKYYARDVVVPAIETENGRATVPCAPGLGLDVDRRWIAENTVRTTELAPPVVSA